MIMFFLKLTQLLRNQPVCREKKVTGKKVTQVLKGIENDPADWIGVYGKVALTGQSVEFENFSEGEESGLRFQPIVRRKGILPPFFEDITERKKAELAVKRQASLIDLSPNAIIVRALDGTIKFWSVGAEKLYGYSKQEALGRTTHDLLQTKFPIPLSEIIMELKNFKSWKGELYHLGKQGTQIVVQSSWLFEKAEPEEDSILESNTDITERKKIEEALIKLKEELEERVGNRTHRFQLNVSASITSLKPFHHTLYFSTEITAWCLQTKFSVRPSAKTTADAVRNTSLAKIMSARTARPIRSIRKIRHSTGTGQDPMVTIMTSTTSRSRKLMAHADLGEWELTLLTQKRRSEKAT